MQGEVRVVCRLNIPLNSDNKVRHQHNIMSMGTLHSLACCRGDSAFTCVCCRTGLVRDYSRYRVTIYFD